MKKVNLLSKAEMRNVLGGIISPEVWLEMCLAGQFIIPALMNDGSEEEEFIKNFIRAECENSYNHMTE